MKGISLNNLGKSIDFLEIINNYRWEFFKKDVSAGLTVAAASFPQVMAFALLLGLNPIYGLYTFIIATMAATLTGRSSYMVVGPTNMVAVTVASGLSSFSVVNGENYLQFVLLLTFLVGIIQIVMGSLNLGKLAHFISRPVIVGFTSGISIIIIASQLSRLLGLTVEKASLSVVHSLYQTVVNLNMVNYYALGIGLFTIGFILFCKKYAPHLPSYLLSLVGSLILVFVFHLGERLVLVNDFGNFSSSVPGFSVPQFSFSTLSSLFSMSFAIAILGFTQVSSILRKMEKKTGEKVDLNKEFISQGIINMVCSFFNSFVVTGSFSKSFMNLKAGAKSRLSELFAGFSVLLFIFLFGGVIGYIPVASLAGIIILVAFYAIDRGQIVKHLFTTKFDAAIFSTTFIITILTPRLDYAIYFGVLVSFLLVLKTTSGINYSHLSYDQNGDQQFAQEKYKNVKEDDYIVINLSGSLHFNTSQNLKEKLNKSFREDKIFVIRMRRVKDIDVTAIQELEKFIDRVHQSGGEIIVCGLEKEIHKIMEQYGLIDKIDSENCFAVQDDIFKSTTKAIKQAENKAEK
ncbi:MAG: SulP family inorganic anion transporter [bacterium]